MPRLRALGGYFRPQKSGLSKIKNRWAVNTGTVGQDDFFYKVRWSINFSPRAKISWKLVQKWPQNKKKARKTAIKPVFLNRFFRCFSTYWDINFVSKCLPAHCDVSSNWPLLDSAQHGFVYVLMLKVKCHGNLVNTRSRWKTTSLVLNWEKLGELLTVLCSCCDITKQVASHWIRVKSFKPSKHHLVSQSVS